MKIGNKEKQIKNNSKFLLYTLGPSKRINEMDTKELRLLSGKAFMMKACSELFDYKDGIDYWNLVEEATHERLQQIENNPIKFTSTPRQQ